MLIQSTRPRIRPPTATVAVVGVAVAALVCGAAGWSLRGSTDRGTPLHVSRVLTGTITIVNQTGTSGCVRPDGGGRDICAALVANSGVRAGQHVRVANTSVSLGDGNGYPLLIVLPDGP